MGGWLLCHLRCEAREAAPCTPGERRNERPPGGGGRHVLEPRKRPSCHGQILRTHPVDLEVWKV